MLSSAGLALALPGAFFEFPQGGGWQEEPPKRGRPEPPTFSKPFEAEGVAYLPFRSVFHSEEAD